jgi:hypothetical protein
MPRNPRRRSIYPRSCADWRASHNVPCVALLRTLSCAVLQRAVYCVRACVRTCVCVGQDGLLSAAATPNDLRLTVRVATPEVRARPCHICSGTRLTPAKSAPGLTRLTPATSAAGLGSPLPHLRRDWAHPCTWTLWTHPCRRPVADHPVPRLRRGCGTWRFVRCRRARTRSRCAGGSASSCRCVACNARMLQRAVLCCSSVFCVAADCTALHQIVLCCSRLYYVASNCTVLHRGAWQDHEPHIFACLRMTAHATHSGARSLLWTPTWFRWPTVWAENDGCASAP